MKRDSMVIYREWKIALEELSMEERCLAWEAIMDYAFDGTVPEDKFLKVVTAMMRQRIDKDQSHYTDACNKRAVAGRLGGLKSGETRRKKALEVRESNEANASSDSNMKQMIHLIEAPKQTKQNEHDNDYDNDILTSLREDEYIRASKNILENWIEQNQITLHSFCKNNHLSIEEIKKYGEEVLDEWRLSGWKSKEFTSGTGEWSASHFQNAIRFKNLKLKQQNASQQQDKFQRRRGADADTWSEEDFKDAFSS